MMESNAIKMEKPSRDVHSRGRRRMFSLLVVGLSIVLMLLFNLFAVGVSAQDSVGLHWERLGKNRIAVWAFSPGFEEDSTLFFGTSSVEKMSVRGIYLSTDRGETWVDSSEGLNPKKRHYYTALMPSPDFSQDKTLWLFGHKTGLSVTEPFGGFWESTDGGATWNEIEMQGFPFRELTNRTSQDVVGALVSPHITTDGIMVAAAGGEGVFISKDKGRNWELLAAVTDVTGVYAPPSFPEEPFLALSTTGSQVMISTDGGKTFETHGNGLPDEVKTIMGVAFSSNFAQDRRMFCFGSGGLYESIDAGQSWKRLATPDKSVSFTTMAVTGDFQELGAIAYGTDDNKIYLSEDMGKTFVSIESETLMGYKVDTVVFAPDYAFSRQIFASSQDGIFRYGPAIDLAAIETSQANAAGVEATRSARSKAASEFKFVPQETDRVETGCIAYMIAPAAIILAFGLRRKGLYRDQDC